MKTSELINKLQESVELFGDNEIVCELLSGKTWNPNKVWSKSFYGHLGISGDKIILFV